MEKLMLSIAEIIDSYLKEKNQMIIAIDGRCASGKTMLALQLQKKQDCNVIHMDHFFLKPEQRTPERLQIPGENIDHERFIEEVMLPLKEGKNFSYRPYNCQNQQLSQPIEISPKKITIVEGSYSCHKNLWKYYDIRIFLTVDPEEQLRRLEVREGAEKVEIFKSRWIPLEEQYITTYGLEQRCDYCFYFSQNIEIK